MLDSSSEAHLAVPPENGDYKCAGSTPRKQQQVLLNLSHLFSPYNVFFNAIEILWVGLGSSQKPVGCSLRILCPKLAWHTIVKTNKRQITKS